MRARLTQEGDWQMSSEMRFYEKRRELNQMLIATENEKLIKANAIKILHRIISETKIPPGQETVEKEAYREKIEEYLRYLDILSKNE